MSAPGEQPGALVFVLPPVLLVLVTLGVVVEHSAVRVTAIVLFIAGIFLWVQLWWRTEMGDNDPDRPGPGSTDRARPPDGDGADDESRRG